MVNATAAWGTDDKPNAWFYKYFDDVHMNTVQNGDLAEDFADGSKYLVPIIYCHGLTCSRTAHSVSCRDLASHGHIVISIDFFDGTASYAVNKNGEEKFWSSNHDIYDRKLRLS